VRFHHAPSRLACERPIRRFVQVGLEPTGAARVIATRVLGQASQLKSGHRALVRGTWSRARRKERLLGFSDPFGQPRRITE
jgi:hypothetical protein